MCLPIKWKIFCLLRWEQRKLLKKSKIDYKDILSEVDFEEIKNIIIRKVKMSNSVLAESLKYNVAERVLIVEDIWDSIAKAPNSLDITEEQKIELDNRLESYHNNPNTGVSWDIIKKRIVTEKNV